MQISSNNNQIAPRRLNQMTPLKEIIWISPQNKVNAT